MHCDLSSYKVRTIQSRIFWETQIWPRFVKLQSLNHSIKKLLRISNLTQICQASKFEPSNQETSDNLRYDPDLSSFKVWMVQLKNFWESQIWPRFILINSKVTIAQNHHYKGIKRCACRIFWNENNSVLEFELVKPSSLNFILFHGTVNLQDLSPPTCRQIITSHHHHS